MSLAYIFAAALLVSLALTWWAFGFLAFVFAACAALIGAWWVAAILTDTL